MKNIFIILVGLAFFACNTSTTENKSVSSSETHTDGSTAGTQDQSDKKEPVIVVKNKADYSEKFVQGLKEFGYKNMELTDSLLVIDHTDTTILPQTPKIGKESIYAGKKDNLAIALTVKRINYTTVSYKIEMVEFGKTRYSQSGQASISSSFFLGAESDEDEQTGEGYFVTEYIENGENNCDTHIRIGDENSYCKIIKSCNGKIKDITLDNFTTLRKK